MIEDGFLDLCRNMIEHALADIDAYLLRKKDESNRPGMVIKKAIVAWWWISGMNAGRRLTYDDICTALKI